MKNRFVSIVTLFALILWGCGSSPQNGMDDTPLPTQPLLVPSQEVLPLPPIKSTPGAIDNLTDTPIPVQEETTPMPTFPVSNLQTLIENARADLAYRLSISVDQINLQDAREVTWSDASLGCPQEGMGYAQVLTPGYLIVLEYSGEVYEYHAGKGSGAFLCENPTPPVPGMPGNT